MTNLRIQISGKGLRRAGLLVALPALIAVHACTDLSENPLSAITPDNFYQNEEEVIGGLAAVYAQMRGTLWGYYNLSEVSTDEIIVPTRGQDWYDNGRWLEIHRQNWSPTSPVGLDDLNGTWVDIYTGITRANVLLGALENVEVANENVVRAELRTLRAFYYYLLMDMFGGVPIVTDTEIKPRERNTRQEVFQFVVSELQAARAALPLTWPEEMDGRMTQGAADAILASAFLNAPVWTGTPRWQDAADAANRIINSGVYSLATNWRSNFTPDNHLSPELILKVKHIEQPDMGMNFVWRSNHYNQTPSGWNGFSTLAETYYAFDQDDERIKIFQVGQQFDPVTGQPLMTRDGRPLVFTPEIKDATQASESEGARLVKWTYELGTPPNQMSNDFAYFRLAEIYLIKAEALNELGQTAEALRIVNMLRERVFDVPEPVTGMSQAAVRDLILEERLFELAGEAKRRQDLIRQDKYLMPWAFKDRGEPYRVLMPIPQTQIDANPLLEQNPGY
jgi:hypothetical protein